MSVFVKVASLDSGNNCNMTIYSKDTSKCNQYIPQTKFKLSIRPEVYYRSLFFFLKTITENLSMDSFPVSNHPKFVSLI